MSNNTLLAEQPVAPPARRPGWRFSIRELLLLTTAAAALVALGIEYYRESRSYQSSLWIETYGQSQHLRAIAASAGYPQMQVNGGGGSSGSGLARFQTFRYHLTIPKPMRGNFMESLRQDAHSRIGKERGSVSGGSTGGNQGDLQCFGLSFESQGRRGRLDVDRVDTSDEEMLLLIRIYEHAAAD